MFNSIFNFSSKKDRDDFIIAIIVIIFFITLFSWLFSGKETAEVGVAKLTSQPSEVEAAVQLDSDNDGIVDSLDACIYLAGTLEYEGCPEPEVETMKNMKWLPPAMAVPAWKADSMTRIDAGLPAKTEKDSDSDGVLDSRDACPETPGVAENGGCPADMDGDGIYDKDDDCPSVKGTKEDNGCPPAAAEVDKTETEPEAERVDTDGDGVFDDEDNCPDKAGDAANNGCPEVKIEKEEADVMQEVKSIQFYYNSSRIRSSSKPILSKVKTILEKYPDYKLKITGHTDDKGSDIANLNLSKARAQACYNFLAAGGIAESRMSFEGKGEEEPVATNDTPEGRHQNRRVEFTLSY